MADNHTYFVGEDGVLVHNYDPKEQGLLFTNTNQANARPDGAKKINEGIDAVADGAKELACVGGGVSSLVCGASMLAGGVIKVGGGLLARIPVVGSTIRAISASKAGQRAKGFFGGAEKVQGTQSIDNLISSGTKMSNVKGGGQVSVKGNIDDVFNSISKGGKTETLKGGRIQTTLPDGTILTKYPATSGSPTIQVNKGGKLTKLRFE